MKLYEKIKSGSAKRNTPYECLSLAYLQIPHATEISVFHFMFIEKPQYMAGGVH